MRTTTSRTLSTSVRLVCLTAALVGLTTTLVPGVAQAAPQNPEPAALVSFTFDDGNVSNIAEAAPVLQAHGLTATTYIVTNCVGMTTAPNTCRANEDLPYMTWDQVTQLQNAYGWEVGSHSVDHQCLASSRANDPDTCQQRALTAAQVEAQMANSKSALASHGIDAVSFAPPYGDYNRAVLTKINKYYSSMRGFQDEGLNEWPVNDYLLRDIPVQETTDTVASLKAQVDQAIATGSWAIFTFHDIADTPSTDPDDYQYGTAELDQLAAYVAEKQAAGLIKNIKVKDGLVTNDTNMLPNGSFNSGVGGGWTADSAGITADTAGNGSYPDPTNSVKLVSGTATGHLFSPKVPVVPETTYLFKSYLSLAARTTGEVGYYVDEYNAAGAWVSGQYRTGRTTPWAENVNFTYTPSSASVAQASLQVIVAGTGITAYVDNAQMFALNSVEPPPPPDELMVNGTFDAGIAQGWTTNAPTTITADAGSHGSPANPVNSVRLQGAATNTHLFSPSIAVVPATQYSVSAYLDVKARTAGEVAFYIDEYDAAGNWVSGQYKLGVSALGAGDVNLAYEPTSAGVAAASLQVIVVGNSGIDAYVDDVRWSQNR